MCAQKVVLYSTPYRLTVKNKAPISYAAARLCCFVATQVCSMTPLDSVIIADKSLFSLALMHWLSKSSLKAHKVSPLVIFLNLNFKWANVLVDTGIYPRLGKIHLHFVFLHNTVASGIVTHFCSFLWKLHFYTSTTAFFVLFLLWCMIIISLSKWDMNIWRVWTSHWVVLVLQHIPAEKEWSLRLDVFCVLVCC